MSPKTALLSWSVAALLILDAGGSALMRVLDMSYAPVGLAAYLLYLTAGGLSGARVGIGWAALVGATLGAAHGTLGWFIAAQLGPASVAAAFAERDAGGLVVNAVVSGVLGAVLASLGGVVGRAVARRRRAVTRTGLDPHVP